MGEAQFMWVGNCYIITKTTEKGTFVMGDAYKYEMDAKLRVAEYSADMPYATFATKRLDMFQ